MVKKTVYPDVVPLARRGINFGLDRIFRVLKYFKNPQNSFLSIHIAGTNGKGSVAAMLSHVLSRQGLNVGLYTSPHLSDLNERFCFNGKPIPSEELASLIKTIKLKIKHGGLSKVELTEFEFLTLAAFIWFKDKNVDIAVIETGLGGRLDATNALSKVLLSVITTIGFDHMEWLGNSIPEIAAEKAGIIKKGVPVFTSVKGEAFRIIEKKAKERNSTVITPQGKERLFSSGMNLVGPHQVENAVLVHGILNWISDNYHTIPSADIIEGIKKTLWPGRFEKFLLKRKNKIKTVFLDGAHNPSAAAALALTLKSQGLKRVNLLFGVMNDKDVQGIIGPLKPFINKVFIVPIPTSRSADPRKLSPLVGMKGFSSYTMDLLKGWNNMLSMKDDLPILVTGSLYLVGEIRKKLRWNPILN